LVFKIFNRIFDQKKEMKKYLALGLISLFLGSCVTQQRGYNYKAHAKKGKKVKYKGDLTKYNCRKR